MANKKAEFNKSISELNVESLKARINDEAERLLKLEFAQAASPLENPMIIRVVRRDIARLKTALRKKELAS